MGIVSSKNLQDVTVPEVQVHVANLGKAYLKYTQIIADNHIDGKNLLLFQNKKDFETALKNDFEIKSVFQRNALVNEWDTARETQAKRQKLMEEKNQTTVQLTNTELFYAPPQVPKAKSDDTLTPFIGQPWLAESLKYVLQQKDRYDGGDQRPLPLALSRCSRGGKTRAIKELMHLIKPEQASCVYVSFNNDTSISTQAYFKDSKQEIFDRIGFAARKGELQEMNWLDFRDTYHVDPKSIGDWLGKWDCILFIDELNLLTSISVEVTRMLKEFFLQTKGRHFCFSSHLATTSLTLRSFLPDPSNREMILRKLPLITSLNEARTKLGYQKLSAREALYFGLIPGLLVERAQNQTITNRRAYAVNSFIAQLNLKGEAEARRVVRDLFVSFITGSVSTVPENLQELMTAEQQVNDVVVRWIPCHLEFLLKQMWTHCDFLKGNRACLKCIYEHLWTYLGSKEESGDAFEALFIVVAIIRCLAGSFESKILPLPDVEDLVVKCDEPFTGNNFNETQDPMVFVKCIPDTLEEKYQGSDQVSIYFPGHARFAAYDVIVAFWKNGGAKKILHGYQLKEGKSTGKPFAYDKAFDSSYLIRGQATEEEKSIRLFTACSEEQVETFFGLSGSQWTPRTWKTLKGNS